MRRTARFDRDDVRRDEAAGPRSERPDDAVRVEGPDPQGRGPGGSVRGGAPASHRRPVSSAGERAELLTVLGSIQSRIYVSDPVTYELLYMNRAMCDAFGDAVGEKCYFAIKGRGTPCPHCTNDKILGPEDLGIPYVWEHQDPVDGRWYRCVDTAVRWPDGRVVRHEMETDITEHKLVEEALRDSETKYRRLLENAQEGIVIIQDGALRFFNPKVPELTGRDPEALSTTQFLDLVHPDDRRLAAERHARRIRGEAVPNNYALRIVTKDGETRWIELNAVLFRWEGRPATLNFVTDITERKRASEALSESEEKHRMLFDSATDAIFVISHGVFIDCNPRAVEIFGYSRSEIIGSPPALLFPQEQPDGSESAERSTALIEACLAGEPQALEWLHRRSDGSTFPSEVRLNRFSVGGDHYVQAIVRDITSRREAEKELRQSRERYGSLFRSSNDGVVIHDLEGRIHEVNQRAVEQLGYDEQEMLSMSVAELHPPEAAEDWEAAFDAVKRDGAVSFEIPFRTKDGRVFPAEVSSSVFEAGGAKLVQKVVRDITERKRAEEIQSVLFHISQAVSASTKLGELLETIHKQIGKLIYTRNFYVALYDAERNAYTFPYYVDECDELDDLTPVELKRSLTDYVRRTGEGLLVDEAVQRRLEEEGEVTLVGSPSPSWMGVPLKVGKRVIGVVVVQSYVEESLYTESDLELLTFVSENIAIGIERKHAEEERARLEAQVQHAQKLESLGVLAGGIAHDFNNLLTGILGYADLTLMRLPEDSPVRRGLQEIKGAAERAAELSRQMLAYSGKGSFVIEPIDLNDVVRGMGNLLQVTIPKGGRLEYDLATRLPLVVADTTQVRQVIMNLITNAGEALGSEEGVITVKSGVLECDRSFLSGCYIDEQLPEGQYVFLEISDTGCGMDRETQSKIFDPFFTTKFTGRGLGLAATLGIVRGHKGTIQVGSELGSGTTFRVLLPAADEDVQAAGMQTRELETRKGTGTVLLVDDEETVRDVGTRMLEEAGLTVVTAADGPEAVEVYAGRADEIGCVVLDLTMPRMSGEETLRQLRRIRSDVRVVLSSGHSEQEVIGRFEGRGIVGFVQKPYLVSRLVSQVGIALRGPS
jgi:two-component system cell cycle sensor histidine kinase/response regulator CckA